MEKFGTLDSSEETVAILGDRWRPRTAEGEGDEISEKESYPGRSCAFWANRFSPI